MANGPAYKPQNTPHSAHTINNTHSFNHRNGHCRCALLDIPSTCHLLANNFNGKLTCSRSFHSIRILLVFVGCIADGNLEIRTCFELIRKRRIHIRVYRIYIAVSRSFLTVVRDSIVCGFADGNYHSVDTFGNRARACIICVNFGVQSKSIGSYQIHVSLVFGLSPTSSRAPTIDVSIGRRR